MTDNECMTTDNEVSIPLGARLFPGVDLTLWFAIVISALGFNLIGDALREALDPKLRGRI